MCGITGAVDLTGDREFCLSSLLSMTAAIAHRGPDDEQVHIEPGVALGARRLSIIDLEGGRQPIANESSDVWVAFNGELFDYPDLRRDLTARGHHLATHCDTETWVHLYEDHGERIFEQARGQFAVSLWDRKTRTLYLARDRVGICPLFYTEQDGWLLWGSEIKTLLSSGLLDARPDPKGIDHFFQFFCAGTTRTCFEGVKSLPPGHYLKVHDGRVEVRRYWDLDFPDAGDERKEGPQTAAEELERLLRHATQRRLRGDVPVVSYISGGLDSTLVLGLSSQERGEAVRSFTIGLDRAGPDERSQATESAELLGSPLSTVVMGRDQIAASYPELMRAAESPVLDTSCACMMRLAERVHQEGFKVALTGEGADEALAGYFWFKLHRLVGTGLLRPFGRPGRTLARNFLLALIGGGKAHRPDWAGLRGVRTAQQDTYELIGQTRETLYTPEMWKRLDGHSPFDDLDLTNDRFSRWHPLNQSLYVGYKVMLPGLLLYGKGDRVAMNSSVETRYPLLDEDVVDFCAGMNPNYKLRRLTDKWMLRRVAENVLPPAIARRPKTMFHATLAKAFLGPGRPEWVDQILSRESLEATGYFDPQAVTAIRRVQAVKPRNTPRRAAFDQGLTAVISTQLWHHIYCGGGLADLPVWSPPSNSIPSSL